MLELKSILQALLLSNKNQMLSLAVIKSLLYEFSETQILKAVEEINNDPNQVYNVVSISGMYYLKVKSMFNSYLSRMHCENANAQYSKIFLETIAALAMYQPITKNQLEEKIGRKILDEIFYQLQDLQWVKVTSTKFDRQEYFSTTKVFLQHFNITSIIELENKLNSILLDSNIQIIW